MMSSFCMASEVVRFAAPFLNERFLVVRDMKPEMLLIDSIRLELSLPSMTRLRNRRERRLLRELCTSELL